MELDWLAICGWGAGSILWAEIVRDLYHALSHQWPWLYRHHVWHHRVFRRDLTFANAEIYQQAQWHNDFPECLVMLAMAIAFSGLAWWLDAAHYSATGLGIVYVLGFLVSCMARGSGSEWARQLTDITHMPGPFLAPPSAWIVNRPYHWRHHFDDDRAYYCSTFSLVDKLMGTALSLKGKTVAVTGASGTLGRSLLLHLHKAGAKPVALTSKPQAIAIELDGERVELKTLTWSVGREWELAEHLHKIDILVLNHGTNGHGDRTPEAIARAYEVNAFSSLRLLNLFLETVRTNEDIASKEVWVNTSEAEVLPAVSPLYELSKRTLGDLVTLRRLDAPCAIRKLVLGPFKSNLNPIGVMSGDRIARQIVALAKRDVRNIIVTINPLTYLLFPLKEGMNSLYFRWFSQPAEQLGAADMEVKASANSAGRNG
ncbi:bifunctional sterol desaturase/short chain dehydrogenase [Synechococcus sp. PCC 7336]|uniref:bifunctional sterol desaturase/short chain dehydrogenase n=1 Tax=Synechococcus sp. PCC 7336 TaxID=195250 RepID=UPI0003495451|nr:bifunctional sterol desaturase/short chain dehydrogenase [Synechococcus sp. PCC 7336]